MVAKKDEAESHKFSRKWHILRSAYAFTFLLKLAHWEYVWNEYLCRIHCLSHSQPSATHDEKIRNRKIFIGTQLPLEPKVTPGTQMPQDPVDWQPVVQCAVAWCPVCSDQRQCMVISIWRPFCSAQIGNSVISHLL